MRMTAASLVVIPAMVVTLGCDGTERGVLDPTPLGTGLTTSVLGIDPALVGVQSVAQPFCPPLPPFIGDFDLNVQATSALDVSLRQVTLTFTDSAGLSAPAVTLPAPALTAQFGSTLIRARSQRAFPFSFPFGCGTGRAGTLVVVVVVQDENGREETARARVAVR